MMLIKRKLIYAGIVTTIGTIMLAIMLLASMTPPHPPPVLAASRSVGSCTALKPSGLDAQGVAQLAHTAGFRGKDLEIAVAVAKAESGWNPEATNSNTNGSTDYGLYQVNSIHEAILAEGEWSDPASNTAMAYKIWEQAGGSWSPWVTYWKGTYRQHLEPVSIDCGPRPAAAGSCTAVDGDWPNGKLPDEALCVLASNTSHRLRAGAANGFEALNDAHRQRFGADICITDSYRTLAAQIDVYARKPGLAARPGTSNHGWGMALDLCGPGGGPWVHGSDYDRWMKQHAPTTGWFHPSWAEPTGSKPEPWHWEFQ